MGRIKNRNPKRKAPLPFSLGGGEDEDGILISSCHQVADSKM